MFDFFTNGRILVLRKSLYCVWIGACAGEDAPLVRVWIDPSMTMFESQVKVHEPDVEAARKMTQDALREGSAS